jgi:Zn-dependent protease
MYPDYMPPRVGFYPPPGYRAPRTSRQEMIDLSIAVAVLTIVFGMPYGGVMTLLGAPLWLIGALFGFSFVAVMLSIFPHELAHKFVAQRYGYWAEFRRNDQFLVISLLLSLFGGFGIAAPGAVMIAGPVTTESNGKISAVGPGTNCLMGALIFPVALFGGNYPLVQYLAAQIVWVNVILGIFNMMPFWIFDGAKVWKWNAGVYICLLALLIVLGVGVYFSDFLQILA